MSDPPQGDDQQNYPPFFPLISPFPMSPYAVSKPAQQYSPFGSMMPSGMQPGLQSGMQAGMSTGIPLGIPSMQPMQVPSPRGVSAHLQPQQVSVHDGPLGSFTYNRPQQQPPQRKPPDAERPPDPKPGPRWSGGSPQTTTSGPDRRKAFPTKPFVDYADTVFDPESSLGLDECGALVPCAATLRKRFVRNKGTKPATSTTVGYLPNDLRLQPDLVCGGCFVHQRPVENCLYAGDRLVECATCNVLTHRRCYGVYNFHARGVGVSKLLKFQCDACAAPSPPSCFFCGQGSGLMKQAEAQPYFAHVWCALCLPKLVTWLDIATMAFQINLPVPEMHGECFLCKTGPSQNGDCLNPPLNWSGGLVGCQHTDCGAVMHPMCLQQYSIRAEQDGHPWGGISCLEVNMQRLFRPDDYLAALTKPPPDAYEVDCYCPQHVLMKTYCFCDRSPEVTQTELMIQCDFCLEWVHQLCLQDLKYYFDGTTAPIDLASQVNFLCPFCSIWRLMFLTLDQEWSEHVRPTLDDSVDFAKPQPASLVASAASMSLISRYRLASDTQRATTPTAVVANDARPVALPGKDPFVDLVHALLAWEQAGIRVLRRIPVCDVLVLAAAWSRRVADLIWADMESLKYNNITITPEEAPKAAKKIQLTKKTGVTSKLPHKRLPKDRTRRGLAVSCLQPGILSIDTLLLWMKIGLCFPFQLPLMTELRRLLASVHGQLSKLSQALQITPPELGPQVYALAPNSSLAWLSHMNLPGLQPRLVKSRTWPGRLGAVNVQTMMAWFKKEGSRVCRALTMDLRGDPAARPCPLALPGLGEPLTSSITVSGLWWCKRVDEPEVRVICGALLFSLMEVKQLVRMLEKQSVMEEISTAVSWDDSRCVWTTSLSCQAIENILQRAPDDAGSVPALEHLKMTQRNIQRFRDELRSLKTKIESRKTPKLDLSDLEQWLQAAARLPEGSLKSDEKKVLSETLDRGRETEEQMEADVAAGDLRQIRTTLAAVQLLPFTSLKLRECIDHVGHLEAWKREFQQLSALMVANPLTSEDRSTKLKKKRKESKYGGYVVLSGQSGFVSDLRKAPVEEPGKDKRFTQNVMIDSGMELLHKAEEIALASSDVETLREWIQLSSDWRKRASQICSTGVVVPAVDSGDIACRLATLAEEISAYREVPFAVDDGTLFAELSNLYETYRAVELELDSEQRKTVAELSTMVATIEAFYGQKISAENSDVDPRIIAIVVRCERCSLWSDLADQCLLTLQDMRALCDGATMGPVPYYPRSFPFDGDEMADNIESLLRTLYLRADDAPAVRLPLVVLYLVLFLQMSCRERQGPGELIAQKLPSLQQSIECALADYVADIDRAAQKLGACFAVPKDSFGIKFAETQLRNVEVAVVSAWILMDFPSAAAAVEINTTVTSLSESLITSDPGLQTACFVRSLGNYLEELPPFFSSLRLLVESSTWTIRAENLLSRSELSELQDAQDVGQLLSEPLGPGQESLRSALSELCQDVQQWLLRLETVYTFDYHPSTWSLSSINPLACHPGVPSAVSVQMPPARVDVLATNRVGARAELVSAALDMRMAGPGSAPMLAYSLGESDVRPLMGCIRAAIINFAAPLSPCIDPPVSDEAMASFHALTRSQHDEFDTIVAHSPRLLRENLVGELASQTCNCGGTCLMCCTIVAIQGAIYRRKSLLWLDECCSLLSSLYSSGGSEELYVDLIALNRRLDGLIACIQATQARLPLLADRIAASVLLDDCDPRVSLGGWLALEALLLEILTEEARQALSEAVNPTTLPFTVWTGLWCQPFGARVSSDGFCLPRNQCSNPFSSVELTLARVVSSALTQLATSCGDLQSLAMSLLPSDLSSTSFTKTVAVWNVGSEEYVFELSTTDGAIFIHFLTMAILVAVFDSMEFSAEGVPVDPPQLPEKLTALMTFARWRVQAACCYLDLERSPCLPHDVLQAECSHGRELLSHLLAAVEQSCVVTELAGNQGARQLYERLPHLLSQCFELRTLGFRQSRTIEILSNYVQRATEKKKVPLSELTAVANRVLGECGVLHPSVESLQLFLEDMQAWAVESNAILQRLQGILSMEKDGDDDGHRVLLNTDWDVCPDAVVSRLSVLAVRSREMGCTLREDKYASLAGRIVNLERSLSTMGQQVDCGGDLTFDRASQHLADILSTFGLSRVSPLSHLGPFLPEESRRVLLRMKLTLEAWKSAERVFQEVLVSDSLVAANLENWLTTLAAAMRTLIPPLPDSSDPPSTGYTLTQKHMLILLRLTWSVVLRAAVVVGDTSGLQMSLTTINTLWSLGRSLLRVSSLSNVSSRLTHGGFSVSWDALAEAEKALCGDQTGGSLWEVEYLKLVRLLARDWINGAKGSLEGWCRRRFFLGLLPVAMHEEYALLRTKFQTRQSVFFELVVERLEGSASGDLVPVEIQELQVFHQRKLKSRFVPPRGCFQEPLLFSTFKTDGKSQKKISELFPEENSSQAIDTTCSLSQSLLRSVIDDITTRMAQSPPAKRPRKLASLVDTDQLKTLYTQSVHDILGASYAARSNDSRSRVVEQANQFLAGQDLFTSEALESVLQEVNSAIQTAFDPNVTVAPKPDVLRSLVAAPAPPPPRPDTTLQDAGFLFKSELVAFVNGRTGAATRHDVSVPFWFLPLFHPVSEELRHLLYQVPQMDFVPADVVMGSSSSRENFGSVTASSMSLVRFLTDVLQRPVDFGSPPISSEGQLSHTELLKFGPLRLPGIICSDWTSRQPTVTNLTSAFRANPICVPCRCQGPCSETSASATADEISGQQMYVCCFSYTPPCSAVSIRLWVIPPLPPPPSSAPSPQSWRYHFPPNVPKSAQMVVGMLDVIPTAAGKHQMHNAAPHGVKYIPMGAIKQTMTSAQEQVAVLERRGIRVPFSSLRTTFPALSFEYSCAFVKPAPSYTPPSVVPQTTVPSSSPTSPPWKTPQARTRPSQGPDALKTLFRGPSNTAPWRKKE